MARRSYTPEQKAEAIELYRTDGPSEVMRRLGIDKGLVTRWAQATGVATTVVDTNKAAHEASIVVRARKREDLRNLLLDKALDLLGRMDEAHHDFRGKDAERVEWDKAPAQACQQYATAAAILVDKFRLEVGEATGRFDVNQRGQVRAAAEGTALRLVG